MSVPSANRGAAFWIGAALLSITIMPIWFSTVFPSQDGPVHLHIVDILRQYRTSWHLQQYFEINHSIEPNVIVYPIMYLLTELFSGPTAEKVFLTLMGCASFPAAVYAMRSFHRDAGWFAVLFLPATYHYLVYKGFYNYSTSLIGFLFGLGYWYRYQSQMRGFRLL